MRLFLFIVILIMGRSASAHLTSDVNFATGLTSLSISSAGNKINLTSMNTLQFSYNLNNPAWMASLNLEFLETLSSNQGPMAWSRFGFGAKYYPSGFNSQRVIFDNRVEGMFWRPAPYVGWGLGLSSLSVSNIGGLSGYLNASVADLILKAGAEVVLTTSLFLTGEVNMITGLSSKGSRTNYDISYSGLGVYMGLKISSF